MRLFTDNMLQQQVGKAGAQITLEIPPKVYLDMTPDCNLHTSQRYRSIRGVKEEQSP
jgi:hypothetical protein